MAERGILHGANEGDRRVFQGDADEMIAQYLIDWASIETRVEEAKDNKDAQILRMQLSSLREKIEKNGVVIVDEDSCLIEKLHGTIVFLESLTDSDEEGFSDLVLELVAFQNVYENRQYYVKAADSQEVLAGCITAWNKHTSQISPQGVAGGVVITDKDGLTLGNLKSETIDSYEKSDTEKLRCAWSSGQHFLAESQKEFSAYLNAFAAVSSGEVLFVDPYWGAVGQVTKDGDGAKQQKRYLQSTKCFVKPFIMNPDVKRIDFLTRYPSDPDDQKKDCICFCTEELSEMLRAQVAGRSGELVLNVEFVEPAGCGAKFHDRFIVNEMYTVSLLDGLDICDERGKIKPFNIHLFGESEGDDNLKRGKVTNYQRRKLNPKKVDLPGPPYERIIRESPRVRLTVNR